MPETIPHHTPFHEQPPLAGEQLAHKLEAAYTARPEDGTLSWLDDRLNRLADWRIAADEHLGLRPGSETKGVPSTPLESTPRAGEARVVSRIEPVVAPSSVSEGPIDTLAPSPVGLRDRLSGRHLAHTISARMIARYAERQHRREQLPAAERQRRRGMVRAAGLLGAAAMGYAAYKNFDFPAAPAMLTGGNRHLNRSTQVARSGSLIAPERLEPTLGRIQSAFQRRRERRNNR